VKVALPVKEASGLEAEVLPTFEGAPFFAILSKKGEDEVEVGLYENPAQSLSEVAQVLLAYGVRKVVFPEVNPLARSAFEELGIEVVDERFKTLKGALEALF